MSWVVEDNVRALKSLTVLSIDDCKRCHVMIATFRVHAYCDRNETNVSRCDSSLWQGITMGCGEAEMENTRLKLDQHA